MNRVGAVHDGVVDPPAPSHSVIGRRFRVNDHYEVGREKVREFARAVQNHHPVHWDETVAAAYGYAGLVAPPTFTCVLGGIAQAALTQILDDYDLAATVQTDQVLTFHRPLVVGDLLTSSLALHSFRRAFGGDLMVVQNIVTDQHDRAVLTAYTTLMASTGDLANKDEVAALMSAIVRHGTVSEPVHPIGFTPIDPAEPVVTAEDSRTSGRALPFAAVSAGAVLAPHTFQLKHGDLVNYAGVAGDANPIHWHSGAATLVGLDRGVVAHGMLTMGLGAGYLSSWLGDPGAIQEYSVRMTSPVYVAAQGSSEVEFTGRVKSVDESNGTATVALTATHAGRKIFGRATAVVRLS
ncbi:fused (3R)-hydroxyacyl-ACP dehydratase subunits HadA/HadB [Nocardia altamirensis]|uniref:fused (3R)-hydroxyacyl-ACP dehydratase subunits HadA/HadB n=1 Tax=Nocardia altamirensis TaxID=472158 RepID=UPI00084049FA|nr:fused (3R)-hydroxyacyl-ACP dehydratase subunits HadA/HadB [Nocardia altamirensis]